MPFVCMIHGPYGDQRDEEQVCLEPRSEHMQLPGHMRLAGAEVIKLGFPSPELALSQGIPYPYSYPRA